MEVEEHLCYTRNSPRESAIVACPLEKRGSFSRCVTFAKVWPAARNSPRESAIVACPLSNGGFSRCVTFAKVWSAARNSPRESAIVACPLENTEKPLFQKQKVI